MCGMDVDTAVTASALTCDFYTAHANSFSDTRKSPWDGWVRLADDVLTMHAGADPHAPLNFLDIGCGNLRLEHFFESVATHYGFDASDISWHCVDHSEALVVTDPAYGATAHEHSSTFAVNFQALDINACLAQGVSIAEAIVSCAANSSAAALEHTACFKGFDAVFCLALMHHIPLFEWRIELLKAALDLAAPTAEFAVSFWQFEKSTKLLAKAQAATEYARQNDIIRLNRGSGDYVMGWQDDLSHLRYCHSFSDAEIDEIIEVLQACSPDIYVADRYSSDGRSGDLNCYVVFGRG